MSYALGRVRANDTHVVVASVRADALPVVAGVAPLLNKREHRVEESADQVLVQEQNTDRNFGGPTIVSTLFFAASSATRFAAFSVVIL